MASISPPPALAPPQAPTQDAAWALAARDGHHPLALVGPASGKLTWSSPATNGGVSFERIGRVALALGDPHAPRHALENTARDFLDASKRAGARACAFYAASEATQAPLRRAGWASVPIGAEPILHLPGFELAGRSRKTLRGARNHALRGGVRIEEHDPHAPGACPRNAALSDLQRAWIDAHGGRTLQAFTDVPLLSPAPPGARRLFLALRGERLLAASLVLRIPARNGWNLHLVRRSPDAPRGTVEALDVETLLQLKAEGAAEAAFGTCPFHAIPPGGPGARIARLAGAAERRILSGYAFDGLAAYKEKFRPDRWETRYLAYAPKRRLPLVVDAVARAQTGSSLRQLLAQAARRGPAERPAAGRA